MLHCKSTENVFCLDRNKLFLQHQMKVIKGVDGHSAIIAIIDEYNFTDKESKIEDQLWIHVGFSGTALVLKIARTNHPSVWNLVF